MTLEVNVVDREQSKKEQLALQGISAEDYIALDTNFIINQPEDVTRLGANNKLLISKQVFYELEKKKSDPELGHKVRAGLDAIEKVQQTGKSLRLVSINLDYNRSKGLSDKIADELIIGSYLYKQEEKKTPVVFLSHDRGARICARDAGLKIFELAQLKNGETYLKLNAYES